MLTNSGYVMTLANSIIGVGILAMPFCFQKCGIILAILLLILSNWITRICCHYLIKTSLLTRRKSFEFLGFHAFGSSGKLLVELCIIGYLLGTCITYFVIVGDLGPQIVTKMFSLESEHAHLRTLVMCVVTLFCVIPLGMLKNVDSLSAVCTASIGFYVCLVLKIVLESKTHIVANDWSEEVVYWQPKGILQCLPVFSMALSCQMQIFEVFTSINNQSLEKLNCIVHNAIWICTFVYIAVGFFGYVAFCTQTFSGNILMNLSPSFGSDVIKIGFVLSVAFSFPLVIFPCRASLYSLLYRKGHMDTSAYIPESRFKAITVFIVIFSMCIALIIPSVELVIGLVGSTIGVAICIMFPAACFRRIIRKDTTERQLAQFIIISGFCLMILGTYANLLAIDEKSSGSHLDISKIDENFNKPTEFAQASLDEKIKSIEKALEEKDKVKHVAEINNIVKETKTENQKNSINQSKIITKDTKSSPPPLPIDELHSGMEINKVLNEQTVDHNLAKNKQQEIMPQVIVTAKHINEKVANNLTDLKDIQNNAEVKKTTVTVVDVQPQTIDNDAIKKDEEVAKEEYKPENEELKQAQKELKKTKDFLEKKVEELKEELVKQNQETHNLVVEKLGEVVEKFGAIERKVQHQNDNSVPLQVEPNNAINYTNQITSEKVPSISITPANKTLNDNTLRAEQIYESLSYKVGELVNNRNKDSALNKRLPLPLPLLRNSSQAKFHKTVKQNTLTEDVENINKSLETNLPLSNKTSYQESEKINMENSRREILQLEVNPEETTATTNTNHADSLSAHRNKRSYPSIEVNENCLTEPKVANLKPEIEIKIGRDLKSINDEE